MQAKIKPPRSSKKAGREVDPKTAKPLVKSAQPRDGKREMTRGNVKR